MEFIGRKRELDLLNHIVKKSGSSLVVIKGRRRVGKSRLVTEFAKDKRFIALSGLPQLPGMTSQDQRDEVSRQLSSCIGGPTLRFDDWTDLFWYLAKQCEKGSTVILLDEISWMAGNEDNLFLGKLKNAWDLHFKKNPKLILILCGSISSWIEKNILSGTGFVGRISLTLSLKELTLIECNQFWRKFKDKVSAYEKLKFLSVTGGVPSYLESVRPELTADENIKHLCFIKEGMLFKEFNHLFNDLFGRRSEIYKNILMALLFKPHSELNDIFDYLKVTKSGVYGEYLEDLQEAGFVEKNRLWSIKTNKYSNSSRYRIKDNYVRFYLKYIMPNADRITQDAFANRTLSSLPGWDTIMGLQFENIVLNNRVAVQNLLHISPEEILYDNPYYQKNTTKQKGCQIDYLIQSRFNSIYVCEIKFSRNPVGTDVIEQMKEKMNALTIPKNCSYRPVLIHVNGVTDGVIAEEYFAHIIDFASLLQ